VTETSGKRQEKKRALISVSDKLGIAEFASALTELGYQLISTGGTARVLEEAGVEVERVEKVTGFPEILGGACKNPSPWNTCRDLGPRPSRGQGTAGKTGY
jgi:phosphoribosylaminoimidazolecarboxamide formyltransferase/IMP cyclohydrolase